MAKLSTQPYKGTRDFYPEEKRVQKFIFRTWRQVLESYGYEEYDAPLIEPTELYKAKTGDEIVNEQTYTFTDRGGRDVTIRPEMTPTVSRMVAAQRQELPYPLRWYSIPNLWRYERPQRGRLREHWQLNVDIFGVETMDAELELILVANDMLEAFGASKKMFTIKINSRQLTAQIMGQYLRLDAAGSHQMMKLLDRRNKMSEEAFQTEAKQIFDGDETNLERLNSLLASKSMADLPEELQDSPSVKEVQVLFTHLRDNGITNAVFDVTLMRGFDYYTDIVFEIFDNHPENNRAMMGGGRYDGLVGLFGVDPVPTAGFGWGDVTMVDFLTSHDLMPDLLPETDLYIAVQGDFLREAQGIAQLLRQQGIRVAVDNTNRKLERQLKAAIKKNVPYVLFVGEQELNDEVFTLRDTAMRHESKMTVDRVVATIKDHKSSQEPLSSGN